jgi:hypothetical protein
MHTSAVLTLAMHEEPLYPKVLKEDINTSCNITGEDLLLTTGLCHVVAMETCSLRILNKSGNAVFEIVSSEW